MTASFLKGAMNKGQVFSSDEQNNRRSPHLATLRHLKGWLASQQLVPPNETPAVHSAQ